jgi:hypothetical protein
MLPLEWFLFIPSLFVAPAVLTAAYLWRKKSESYRRFWPAALAICFVLTALFTFQVLTIPYYSERNHSPDNPGGFSTGPFEVIAVFLLQTCIVIPAFPMLLGLVSLPPRGRESKLRAVLVFLYLVAISVLIVQKHVTYMADYRRERSKPKQTPFERFRHLREGTSQQPLSERPAQ